MVLLELQVNKGYFLVRILTMCTNKTSLFLLLTFMPTILFGMETSTPAQKSPLNDRQKIEREIKKNKSELETIRKKTTLAKGLALVEPKLQTIISSPKFQAEIEKMATKEAQDMAQGKGFSKTNHTISQDFPAFASPNRFLSWVYSLMANIAHYELLLSKLGSTEQQPVSTETATVTTTSESTKAEEKPTTITPPTKTITSEQTQGS